MTEAYPLHWPESRKRERNPQRSRFNTTMASVRDELLHELKRLGARHAVVSTNIPLRNDGLPYASHRQPDDRGVAVYFLYKGMQVCFACDRWDLVQDNMQAIRHTISALRGISRWGTGDMVESAFRGFDALPPPVIKWFEILGVPANASLAECEAEYKKRAKSSHPDNGGCVEEMIKLNSAIREARELAGQFASS